MTMVERLSASAKTAREDAYQEGREVGVEWATEHADYDELHKLRLKVEGTSAEAFSYREFVGRHGDNDPELWEIMNDSVFADGYEGRDQEPFFMEYIAGVVEGAVEAFEKVRSEVEG